MPDRCPVCGEPGENFGYGTVSITPCEKPDPNSRMSGAGDRDGRPGFHLQ